MLTLPEFLAATLLFTFLSELLLLVCLRPPEEDDATRDEGSKQVYFEHLGHQIRTVKSTKWTFRRLYIFIICVACYVYIMHEFLFS